jgi:hypothetical protein
LKNTEKNRLKVNFSFFKKAGVLLLAVFLFSPIASHRAEAAIAYDNSTSGTGLAVQIELCSWA